MSKQHSKVEKRRRRQSYLKRKKVEAKAPKAPKADKAAEAPKA
jgi:hypothetical protein